MDINTIATTLATTASGISGIRGASAKPLDTIPGTPYAIIGPVQNGTVIPGSWERVHMRFPLWIYIDRTADAARTQNAINSYVNGVIAAYRSGGTESATVASTLVTEWRTDMFETVGATEYQVLEFFIDVVVNSAVGYTP